MSDRIESRRIAEHLSTLASLLEAEAIRANALGIHMRKDLMWEAKEARALANQLWNAGTQIRLDESRDVSDLKPAPLRGVADGMDPPGRLALIR